MNSDPRHTVLFKEGIPTRTEALHHVRGAVEGRAIDFGFDRETAFRIALAVDEACTNIILHSYGNNPAQTFDIEIATDAKRFIVVLTDHGRSFDPSTLPEIDMCCYLEGYNHGGLGVHIIRLVMDQIQYATEVGENRLSMVKFLV